jgi:NAD(P) transhydrogenase subunit alpha
MKVSVPKESAAGETRVAITPEVVKKLTTGGVDVVVEPGAGASAHIPDAAYEQAGAKLEAGAGFSGDVVAKVAPPSSDEIGRFQRGAVLIGFLQPLTNGDTARALASAGVTAFAMEAVPRITRAQSMDALSSQATVGGYRAALIAAQELGRFFPMLTTAAGTIRPAKVLVLGAGVAGLQAIATARRLGAVVSAFDVRAAVKEQIESLGARFVELDIGLEDAEDAGGYARALTEDEQQRQREALADVIAQMDVVISTAAVPGRRAPLLIIEDAVQRMPAGSVIVDLAAETGGNCELTEPAQTVVRHDVKIVGTANLPASMPDHASQLYAKNVQSLLGLMATDEGALQLDFEDEIIAGACITRDGEIVHEGAKAAAGASNDALRPATETTAASASGPSAVSGDQER